MVRFFVPFITARYLRFIKGPFFRMRNTFTDVVLNNYIKGLPSLYSIRNLQQT